MPTLKLLGAARLEVESGVVTGSASHRHTVALLALLSSVHPSGIPREKLVGYLWPDASERTARNRLSTLVHRVRKALGKDVLRSVKGELVLEGDAIASDLGAFQAAVERGDLEAAAGHYAGPFMDGFFLAGSAAFDHWLEAVREELRQRHREVLDGLADAAAAQGRWEQVVQWRRRVVREVPLDSRAVARLMDALVEAGNPAGALEAARSHEDLVREEFGTGPGDEVLDLVRQIRSGSRGEEDAPGGTPGHPQTLALLPFETPSDGQEAGLFAEGLHHDLFTQFSRMPDLRVISRASVLRYRDRRASIPEVGAALGVGMVLEGAVRQHGNRVRFTVQLVEVASDAPRWGETYDRNFTEETLFDVQAELARRVASSLRSALGLGHSEPHRRAWLPTENLEAYRLCAQARACLDQRTETGMRQAVDFFRQALDEDPGYAPAWVGLADSSALLFEYGYAERDILNTAETAAHRAVELDPGLGEAHTSLGLVHEARYQGPEAVRAYLRAVQLQPGYANPYNWLSWTYQNLGRPREALEWSRKAVALNPLATEVVANLSITLLMTGDAEGALAEARRSGTLAPDETSPLLYEALALDRLGRLDEAASLLEGLRVPWSGEAPRTTLALLHEKRGRHEEACRILRELEEEGEWGHAGLVLAGLGRLDRAFETFARVSIWTFWPTIPLHSLFPDLLSPLRADVRFGELIGRVRGFWGLNPDGSFPGA
jgi:TolB-like protein/Flp pilus assembly protein TadD